MQQLIRIAGPTEPMRRLGEVDGLDFERTSARRLGDDRWQVSGYATDAAIAELQAGGLEVEAVIGGDELTAQRDVLFSKLDADRARETQAEAE